MPQLDTESLNKENKVELLHLVSTLLKFRFPHKKVADDNFKLRQDGEVGSGSYTPDILGLIIQETVNFKNLIQ